MGNAVEFENDTEILLMADWLPKILGLAAVPILYLPLTRLINELLPNALLVKEMFRMVFPVTIDVLPEPAIKFIVLNMPLPVKVIAVSVASGAVPPI